MPAQTSTLVLVNSSFWQSLGSLLDKPRSFDFIAHFGYYRKFLQAITPSAYELDIYGVI